VYVRSSDVIVGLPYDVMHYALLLDIVYEELVGRMPLGSNLARGSLLMTLAHAHVYDRHFDLAWKMLGSNPVPMPVQFPAWSFEKLLKEGGDKYVATVKGDAIGYLHPFHERVEAVL
jgi:thymidylate synthase